MKLRRRIALLIDPELASLAYGERPFWWSHPHNTAELHQIAETLKRLDSKFQPRKPRIIECRHPELHGVDMAALGYTPERPQ